MPRKTGLPVPKLRHHKATGQAAVVLDGKWFYLGRFGSDDALERYNRAVAEWLSNGRRRPPASTESTVASVLLSYWRFAETYYRKNGTTTDELYGIKAAMRPLKRLYASLPARSFTPLKLVTVRQEMVRAGHSRKYINDNVNRIKRIFKWAAANELVEPQIFHALQAVGGLRRGRSEARETEPVRPVDDCLVDAVQPHVSTQVWAMIELQRLTGMRSGEVVIMRSTDIETGGRIWLYRPSSHKTEHHGYQRVIELGPRAQAVIMPFLQREITAYLFSPVEAEAARRAKVHRHRRTPLSYGNRPGSNRSPNPTRTPSQRYTADTYRRAIERGIRKAFPHPELSSIPRHELTQAQQAELQRWYRQYHWHPHQLRHAFATRVRKLFGLEAARILLGQATVAAAEIYAEVERSRAAQIAAKIG